MEASGRWPRSFAGGTRGAGVSGFGSVAEELGVSFATWLWIFNEEPPHKWQVQMNHNLNDVHKGSLTFHLLVRIWFNLSLFALKGICHCWKERFVFFQGAEANGSLPCLLSLSLSLSLRLL